jgi:hypothetical protein
MLMTAHLPNTTTAPPGQWKYRMPETGQMFGPSPDLEGLIIQLRASYKANGYDIPHNLPELIEAFICADVPNYCNGDAPPSVDLRKLGAITYHTVMHSLKRFFGSDERVPQELAEKRAAICVTCTENVSRTDCTSCNLSSLRNAIVKIIGSRKTSFDDRLQVCRVCICEVRAKVHLPLSRLEKLSTESELEQLPAHCWQRTERNEL